MKRETLRHPKTYDLASRLGCDRPTALGYLTLLWDHAGEVAIRGDIGKWPNGAIAGACDWLGDPDVFVGALVASGWLDAVSTDARLLIHDSPDHCETWIKKKLQRAGQVFRVEYRWLAAGWDGKAPCPDSGAPVSGRCPDTDPPTEESGRPSDTLSEPNRTEPNRTEPNHFLSAGADGQPEPSGPTPQDFQSLWDSVSCKPGLARVRKWTPARLDKIRTRLREPDWWEACQEAVAKLPLPAGPDKKWQPDVDWFLANRTNVYKIIEGKYDWRAKEEVASAVPTDEDLENYSPHG
jgi:hypothetical protein